MTIYVAIPKFEQYDKPIYCGVDLGKAVEAIANHYCSSFVIQKWENNELIQEITK